MRSGTYCSVHKQYPTLWKAWKISKKVTQGCIGGKAVIAFKLGGHGNDSLDAER